jgi:hypothetical protein
MSNNVTSSATATAITNNTNPVSINSSNESSSIIKSLQLTRKDKLESSEVKDLLICALYILRNISEDALLGLWYNYEDGEFVEFLSLLELCLRTFRYRGRDNIEKLYAISKSKNHKIKNPREHLLANVNMNKANGLDVLSRIANSSAICQNGEAASREISAQNGALVTSSSNTANSVATNEPANLSTAVLIESNLCHQSSLIVINILSLVLIHQKEKLCENNGNNVVMHRLIEIYFHMLQSYQSELIKLRVLASLRHLVNKSSSIFLSGHSILCSSLCLEMLKCFNSKFESVRSEACVVLYMLMRKNYEHAKMKSIARVHSQTIISVSQLIGKCIKNKNVD